MTIAKQLNRKKQNQKLFNKLMAFYFAIMVMCAFEIIAQADFITDSIFNPKMTISYGDYDLRYVKNADILNEITEKGLFSGLLRWIGVGVLRGLAALINYFEDALSILLKFNIYDAVKAAGKDLDVVKSWAFPIAWAVFSVALIFVAILLIFNADKSRITDFARGIIISGCLLLVLSSLPSLLTDLKNKGVNSTEKLNPARVVIDKDGVATKQKLGDYLFASNTIDVDASVKDKNNIVYVSDTDDFKQGKISISDIGSDMESKNIKQGIGEVKTSQNSSIEQTNYSSLSLESKIELGGGAGAKNLYQMYQNGQAAAQNNRERYFSKSEEERKKEKYTPYTAKYMGYTLYFLQEDAQYLNGTGAVWFENKIAEYVFSGVKTKLKDRNVNLLDYATFYKLDYYDYKTQNIADMINILENNKIKLDEYSFGALEWVNVLQNKDLVYSPNTKKENKVESAEFHNLYTREMHQKEGSIGKVVDSLTYPFAGYEAIYRYNYRFVMGIIEMAIIAVCLFFAALKVASTLFDILFAQIIAPIVVASDLHGAGRAKQVIQNLISSYLVLVCVVLVFRIYILVILGIKNNPSLISNNIVIELIIVLAGAKFVIDGPDLIVKILGIDAGVKSGLGTVMGIRTAASMARGAAHTASSVVHAPSKIAGKVGGNLGSRVEAYRNSRDSGHHTARNVASFVTNGGTSAGRAFTDARNSSYSRNASTANRQNDGQHVYNNSSNVGGQSTQSGNSGGAGGNNGGATGGTGGHGGAGGNTTVIAGGKGEKGDTGAKGEKGDKGEQGIQGMQGRQGEKGEDGNKNEGFAQRELRNEQMRGHGLDD
ncbi:MAG: collagen-like protein [Ruminococcus sp.]|nr:collagen-like protein [Ruminococcus sp.]